MSGVESEGSRWQFVGGLLCLDFTNTVNCYDCERPTDDLAGYEDLVEWGRHAGAIDEDEARRLLREASRKPDEAAATLERVKAVREATFRVIAAAAQGQAPAPGELEAFNVALSHALARARLVPEDGGLVWGWEAGAARAGAALDRVLWPVLHSAAVLLTSDQLGRVRECGGEECTWLFLDMSKNRSRRWCEMKGCGNRAKSRRHYARTRAERGERPGAG
jgi:predicted RNA-binding Zn ribbon-like protein